LRIGIVTPGRAPNEEQVVRIGRSVSIPANGSICPVAVDVRMRAKVRRMLQAERFDILHLHEPLMPTLCPKRKSPSWARSTRTTKEPWATGCSALTSVTTSTSWTRG